MSASSSFTTVMEWLNWLGQHYPQNQIELGLDRVRKVADYLLAGAKVAPQVITVAGTNGKGSTIAYLSSIMAAAHVSYASFTSPHLVRFNERICCNGRMVSDAELVDSFTRVDAARHAVAPNHPVQLTFFEFNALLAFDLMRQWQPQVALLEIGLGGRLDAVNVIDADIAIVTSIALDHVDRLGSDIDKIGYEKAGIYRANKVAIFGQADGPASVAKHAQDIGALWYHNGDQFMHQDNIWTGLDANNQTQQFKVPKVHLPVPNVAAVIQAVKLLPLAINDSAITTGLENACLIGRMQEVNWQGRTLILDVAHNPQAAHYVVKQLQQILPANEKLHCVFGILAGKDYKGVIEALSQVVGHWHIASTQGVRGLDSQVIKGTLSSSQNAQQYDTVIDALQGAVTSIAKGDKILVCGSFHTVGDTLAWLEGAAA